MKNKITKKDKKRLRDLLEAIHFIDHKMDPPISDSEGDIIKELTEWGFFYDGDQWTRFALWYFEKNDIPFFD